MADHSVAETTVNFSDLHRSVDQACELIDELRAQRDELLSAAKLAGSVINANGPFIHAERLALEKLQAAIARAERRL